MYLGLETRLCLKPPLCKLSIPKFKAIAPVISGRALPPAP